MTIKVIGAGFGRTGGTSLKAALEELGFGKCYNMREVIHHPEHARIWNALHQGKIINWRTLFQGYRAVVDWPACAFYQTLIQRYPEAKVILTVRDPERWYESALSTIYRVSDVHRTMWEDDPVMQSVCVMLENIVWSRTFHKKFEDKSHAIALFSQHIAQVKQTVSPERLLVYEVSMGWEPLCQFLTLSVPKDKPFPHLNDTAVFRRRWKLDPSNGEG